MNKQFPTSIAISQDIRSKLVNTLNVALATTIDLQLQVKQAHWNIKGPQFFARHELFDAVAERLRETADVIAERAATLGGYAQGTVRLSASHSTIPEYNLDAVDGRQHIQVLVSHFATYTKTLRQCLEEAENCREPVTADMYTAALKTAELDTWFLESHLNV